MNLYAPVVANFSWPALLTLTLKVSGDEDLHDLHEKMIHSFRKLRQRDVWDVKRGIFSVELIHKEDGIWYCHGHGLIDSKWVDQKELSGAWFEITGNSFVVDVRRVFNTKQACLEVLKYVSKLWELTELDKELIEKAFKHSRFINSFGVKRPDESPKKQMICVYCGGRMSLFEDFCSKRGPAINKTEDEIYDRGKNGEFERAFR
jgi:hypothetical protein